jgi:tRNA pseudouridine55 synthase
VELPIPAASAVKIGGERAYRLARRGVAVDMPLRRSHVHTLDVIDYSGAMDLVDSVRLELHVSSGTYVRAIAQVLGGHCTTLRRIAIGPFSIEEAASDVESAELIPVAVALDRLSTDALGRVPDTVRAGVLALESASGEGAA